MDNRSLDNIYLEQEPILLILVARQTNIHDRERELLVNHLLGLFIFFMIFGPSTYLRRKDLKEPL